MMTRRAMLAVVLSMVASPGVLWAVTEAKAAGDVIQAKGAVAELSGENAWFSIEGRRPWGSSREVSSLAISYYVYDPVTGLLDSDDLVVELHADQLHISPSNRPGLSWASLNIEVPGPGGDLTRPLALNLRWEAVGNPQTTTSSFLYRSCVLSGMISLGGQEVTGLKPPYIAPYLYQVHERSPKAK